MRRSQPGGCRGSPKAPASRGCYLALCGTVLVFVLIGGLKFTAYEAEAIWPLVEASPLLGWAYAVLSVRGFSNLRGVIGFAAAAVGTFAVTSSIMLTGPVWEASLGGFPALSPAAAASSSRAWCCSAWPCPPSGVP